jgi:cbb3-type cytochrome oxidase subunit 3
MIDARILFLLLTALLLALLTAIVVLTYRKKRKQNLEEPKYRMLEDD